MMKSQRCQNVVYQENKQLKDALQRSSFEVCRLIEDKRELEDLIEKLNKSMGAYRQSHSLSRSVNKTGSFLPNESMTVTSAGGTLADEMMNRVITEKDNYIGGLENEVFEMRKEIEIQREQLL